MGVIGAGVIGLSTAYYLARGGANVTLYDSDDEDARPASWGNAGHVVPVMSVPVTSMKNITDAAMSLVSRNAFVTVPREISPGVLKFLAKFVRNSARSRWLESLARVAPVNRRAIEEFDALRDAGLDVGLERGPFVSAFGSAKHAEHQLEEFVSVATEGLDVQVELLDVAQLHDREPLASHVGRFGVVLKNQALLNPPRMLRSLRTGALREGVKVLTNAKATAVRPARSGIHVHLNGGRVVTHEKVVIATGAWLDELAAPHGINTRVLAGFGYSMLVDAAPLPEGMLYFPDAKIATTRMGERLRVSTLLQIDKPSGGFRDESAKRLLSTARSVLPGVDWDSATDMWHGGRPLSATGRPVIGETKTPNVYVNGGHGMWGVTLGPISGRLLAEAILEGRPDIEVQGFTAR